MRKLLRARIFPGLDSKNKTVLGLAAAWLVVWLIAAIHPVDRQAWLIENLLVFLFVAALALMHRRLALSTASWVCITLFLMLHAVGAHFTYAQMPLGIWARDTFGLARNHYDRVAHGAFGLVLALPIRELLVRFGGVRHGWSFFLPPVVILAVSGLFEIIEAIVAELVAPGNGAAWLGAQGDEWDAQNDMLIACVGAIFMMGAVALTHRKDSRK
jgi:putative membrane protein